MNNIIKLNIKFIKCSITVSKSIRFGGPLGDDVAFNLTVAYEIKVP